MKTQCMFELKLEISSNINPTNKKIIIKNPDSFDKIIFASKIFFHLKIKHICT